MKADWIMGARIVWMVRNPDLGPLELWYELGESRNQVERVTQEEVLDRLDFLFLKGFVEKISGPSGTEQLRYRVKREIGGCA